METLFWFIGGWISAWAANWLAHAGSDSYQRHQRLQERLDQIKGR
jgi:hypothetical protein